MNSEIMKHYKGSFVFAIAALISGLIIGYMQQPTLGSALSVMITVAILAVLETSLSIDNAVVNAKILTGWDDVWRSHFLNWGIWVAVFGMRVVFPIAIVSIATGIDPIAVVKMALLTPSEYATHMHNVHHEVAGFGGAFLFMVALGFFFAEKHVYWLETVETRLTKLGQIEGIAAAFTLGTLLIVSKMFHDATHGQEFFIAGVWGVVVFIISHGLGSLLGNDDDDSSADVVIKAGLAGFLYLELLDSAFSFDGVVGALVITNYLPVIALGLGTGAFFVRSMTLHLVETNKLAEYRYLEHGAFYAILALAILMFASGVGFELPEWFTGLLGASFIAAAMIHSIKWNKANP